MAESQAINMDIEVWHARILKIIGNETLSIRSIKSKVDVECNSRNQKPPNIETIRRFYIPALIEKGLVERVEEKHRWQNDWVFYRKINGVYDGPA